MINLLSLPEEYKVDKTIDKESFIKKANLTPAERKEVEEYLSSVKILYDVWFSDKSELVFLEISVKYLRDNYTVRHLASCVASCVPHMVLLFVHCPMGTQIIAFQGRPNMNNDYRTRVLRFVCSPYFHINNSGYKALCMFEKLRNLSTDFNSANKCNQVIFRDIESWKLQEHVYDIQLEKEEKERRHEILRIMDSSDYDIDTETYFYRLDTGEQKRFVLDCCNYCYGLYLEYTTDELFIEFADEVELDEESWLINYVDACNELAQLLRCDDLNAYAIRMIKSSFDTKEDYSAIDYEPEMFEDIELKEILDRCYNKEWLLLEKELLEDDEEEE